MLSQLTKGCPGACGKRVSSPFSTSSWHILRAQRQWGGPLQRRAQQRERNMLWVFMTTQVYFKP